MSDWNDQIIAEFRANGGKVGGQFEGAPLLIIHSTGAKTGQERLSPVMYLPDGDRWLVFASYAGADTDPAWFTNLMKTPDAAIEVGTETVPVTATSLPEPERTEKYAQQAALYPGFADYEQKTTRVIPVVALTRR